VTAYQSVMRVPIDFMVAPMLVDGRAPLLNVFSGSRQDAYRVGA